MGSAVDGIAVALDVGHRGQRRVDEAVGERPCPGGFACDAPVGELGGGRAEADDAGDVLDATAASALLRAAHDERREPEPAAYQQRADALGAAELVGGHRAEVGAETDELEVDVADGRARVDVHDDAALACLLDDGGRRLQGADLVVGELDRHQCGVGADRADHLVGVEAPDAVDADLGDREPVGAPAGVEDRGVLDRRGDDVTVPGARERTPDRGVDRLGAARREHHFARAGAEQRRDLLARGLDRDARRRGLRRAVARDHRGGRGDTAASPRTRCGRSGDDDAWSRYARATGCCSRQTRATQWSSPSGRLVSNCGDVSP